MNSQCVTKHGFEMYLAKYISKPESSFDVKLSKNPSDPERYLRTRIIGACEALDVQLGFNQYHMSRNTVFSVTEINPAQFYQKLLTSRTTPKQSKRASTSTQSTHAKR